MIRKIFKTCTLSMLLVALTTMTPAQSATVTYVLEDIWLLPDLSHPLAAARQMTGSFEWIYEEGDFENGSGQFADLFIPWYNPDIGDLNINIDLGSIEFTLPGNFHDLGVDLTLFLVDSFRPDQAVAVDTARSMFDIQQGISYKGHAVSGSIVPVHPGDFDYDGDVDGADFLKWQRGELTNPPSLSDLEVWQANFGPAASPMAAATIAAPEPGSAILFMMALACGLAMQPRPSFLRDVPHIIALERLLRGENNSS